MEAKIILQIQIPWSPNRRFSPSSLHFPRLIRASSSTSQEPRSFRGPKPSKNVVADFVSKNDDLVRSLPIYVGGASLLAVLFNRAVSDIKVCHGDFLSLNPQDPSFAKVRAILLDPSCSGSGTITDRLDHLLPSHSADSMNYDPMRLVKLAVFQKKALAHALSFPQVERVVYSTCSIHQTENEDVVSSVLPLASSFGFELTTPFPQWQRRGLPVFKGSEHVLRMDPVEDKEGFFIALFTKTNKLDEPKSSEIPKRECRPRRKQRTIQFHPYIGPKMIRAWGKSYYGCRRKHVISTNSED